MVGDVTVGTVERKTIDNLRTDLVSGNLGFAMAELSTLPAAAVVVEDRYTGFSRASTWNRVGCRS